MDKVWALKNRLRLGGGTVDLARLCISAEAVAATQQRLFKEDTKACRTTNTAGIGNVLLQGQFKVNVDAAFKDGVAAVGWVEKDWEGVVTDAGATKIRCSSALVVETTTMLVGLEAARNRGRRIVLMEGDNQGVINALQGKADLPWEAEIVVTTVRRVMEGFNTVSVNWVRSDKNSMANGVARWMLSSGQGTLATRQDIPISLLTDYEGF